MIRPEFWRNRQDAASGAANAVMSGAQVLGTGKGWGKAQLRRVFMSIKIIKNPQNSHLQAHSDFFISCCKQSVF